MAKRPFTSHGRTRESTRKVKKSSEAHLSPSPLMGTRERPPQALSPLRDAANYPLIVAGLISSVLLLIADRYQPAFGKPAGTALTRFGFGITQEAFLLFGFAVWGTTLAVVFWDRGDHAWVKRWLAEPFVGLGYHACPYATGVMIVSSFGLMLSNQASISAWLTTLFLAVLTMFFSYAHALVREATEDSAIPTPLRALAYIFTGLMVIEAIRLL